MGVYLSGKPITEGIPKNLAIFLKERLGILNFIETGTYYGGTTVWASSHFDNVETVEAYEDVYLETKGKFSEINNIKFHLGNSKDILPSIIKNLNGPSLFFLDAHEFYWSDVADIDFENAVVSSDTVDINWDWVPLLEELTAIRDNCSNNDYCIVIDDIRLITLLRKTYPDLIEIIRRIDEAMEYTIYHDTLVVYPKEIRSELFDFFSTDSISDFYSTKEEKSLASKNSFLRLLNLIKRIYNNA